MEKDSNLICRINSGLKEASLKYAKKYGYTLSDIVNAFLQHLVDRDYMPMFLYKYLPRKYDKNGTISIAMIKMKLEESINARGKGLIKKAYLFGSYSRGEEKPSSDIDIRLETDEGLTLFDLGNIRQDLVDCFDREVDLLAAHKESLDPAFYNNIRKEEICLYER